MAGYQNYSMSNNAVDAYENGEKPLSKWTKQDILDEMRQIGYSAEMLEKAKSTNVSNLKSAMMRRSSWHHTSCKYNRTNFYSVDSDKTLNDLDFKEIKKVKIEKVNPMYVVALVRYDDWRGSKKHPKKVEVEEVVKYMSNEKMVDVSKSENTSQKRLSNLTIIKKIEQKTKFSTKLGVI